MEIIPVDPVIRKVQLKCLEILIEIKRICEKNDIQFFLIGGTALGAYRHSGFIPWDDDIDIGMPREDYLKFIKICETELSEKYYLQTPNIEKIFTFPFTKIRANGTLYKEQGVANLNIHHGVFVDIFPLDDEPVSKIMWNIQKYVLKVSNLIRMAKIDKYSENIWKRIIKYPLNLLYPRNLLKLQYEFALNIGNYKNSNRMGNFLSGYSYGTEIMDKTVFGVGKEMIFEGHKFVVPELIEEFLTQMYGEDYFKIPPKEKRINHTALIIKGV